MKAKIFLPLGAWLLLALQANGQYSFSGRVTAGNVPVEGATLMLQGRRRTGAVSGAGGAFTLRGVPAGDYRLQVSCLGYKTIQKDLSITGSVTDTTIVLEKRGLFIRPVEVLSTRAGKDAPFTQTTLSAADISQKNLGQDLPFLLKDQPSVITTSDAGAGVGYTNIWIRGSDVTRINVTFNGIPVNDAESAGTFWVDIPDIASSTGSIQIQRGVGTSTNGAGAFGATINLSTNTFHAKPYGELMSSFGSFNTWKHEVRAGSGLLNGHFTVDARLSSITSDGYIDRASSDLKSFYLSTAYLSKKSSLRLNVFSGKEKTYQAWDGVPADSLATHRTYNDLGLMPDGKFYTNQTDNYLQTYYQLFWNQEFASNLNFNVAAFLTRGKGYYEEYKAAQPYAAYGLEDPVIGADTLTETDLIRDLWLDNYYYGAIFSVNKTAERWKWTLGGGWDRYEGKHYGDVVWARYGIDKDYRYYYNTADKNDFNVYWKADRQLATGLHAFLDLQYRHIRYNIYGYDDNPSIIQLNTYDFFNPKAGLSYRFDHDNRLYLSYARASKEPNRDDFEAGRGQTPKAEHLGDWELGYDRGGSRYHLHGNLYYMNYRNQLVLTGKINDVGAYTRTNIPRSYRLGLELNGDVSFARIWTFSANAAFSRNRILDFTEYIDDYDNGSQKTVHHGTTDISFSPAVITGAALTAAPLADLSITLRGKYVSRLYLDNSSEKDRSIDPYLVNSLQLQYAWHPAWIHAIRLNLMIHNLFNVKYLTNGYTYSYISGGQTHTENSYFPQEGINFLAGLTVDL
jgi:iron complex outermembrane receptor protein